MAFTPKINEKKEFVNYANKYQLTDLNREWDLRVNVDTDDQLDILLCNIKAKLHLLSYVLVGGLEIGTNPHTTDYQHRHTHIIIILKDRKTGNSVVKNFELSTFGQYYIKKRIGTEKLTYGGWYAHHTKELSKVNPQEKLLFEFGTLPKDKTEFKEKSSPKWEEIVSLAKDQQWKSIEAKYPFEWMRHRSQLRLSYWRQADDIQSIDHAKPLWIHGPPGTGKSAYVHMKFSKLYKKDVSDKWWDGFDLDYHECVYIEDFDPDGMLKLGFQKLKIYADSTGFAGDKKYGGLDIIRGRLIITSNFTIDQCIYPHVGIESTKQALHRRFEEIHINTLLLREGIELRSKSEISMLKADGNADYSKLFKATEPQSTFKYAPADDIAQAISEVSPLSYSPTKVIRECPWAPSKTSDTEEIDNEQDFNTNCRKKICL